MTGNVGGNVVGSVGSVTAGVTVTTNNDKTGYGLSSTETSIVRTATAQAGAAGSITLDASASATTQIYAGCLVKIVSGTGAGQTRVILTYNGSTKVATVDWNWTTTPDNTSVFVVLYADSPRLDNNMNIQVGSYAAGQAPLQPTVSGRTLDVTTTGEAGIDWANIGSPTTTVNLSGTSISSTGLDAKNSMVIRNGTAQGGASTSITLDASANGTTDYYVGQAIKIDSSTGVGQTRIITAYNGTSKAATVDRAWAVNPDATSVFTVYSASLPKLNSSLETVAASVTGNVSGTVAGLGAGSVNSTSIAAGAITAAKFGADAIDSSALAASAASEIAAAVWDLTTSGHVTSGTFGQSVAPIRAGTAQAGSGTNITLDASASATNSFIIMILSSLRQEQALVNHVKLLHIMEQPKLQLFLHGIQIQIILLYLLSNHQLLEIVQLLSLVRYGMNLMVLMLPLTHLDNYSIHCVLALPRQVLLVRLH